MWIVALRRVDGWGVDVSGGAWGGGSLWRPGEVGVERDCNLTSFFFVITYEEWIACDIYDGFRPLDSEFEVKNIEKWRDRRPPGP